jgi:hypothetical protein
MPLTDEDRENYRDALEVAHELAVATQEFMQQQDPPLQFADVKIVLGNPTVKEYRVSISPGGG